ncbi:MAG: hypothetical protein IJ061_08810 [Lachnospiraceae bacterium]|nr:hypothetical protein [Lachnospiraceae bacterium]
MTGYNVYNNSYNGYDRNKEIREAIAAGERALSSMRAAQNSLDSARGWGILDMFGGNLITGLIKHSKVSDASRYVDAARRDMAYFQNELQDIRDLQGLDIRIGDFLTFADFFWDGFLADILVQSKINDARKKIADAINRTESVVSKLRNSL